MKTVILQNRPLITEVDHIGIYIAVVTQLKHHPNKIVVMSLTQMNGMLVPKVVVVRKRRREL